MWSEKVFCPHCGMLTNKATYCKFCGKPLSEKVEEKKEEEKVETMEQERAEAKPATLTPQTTSETTPPPQETAEERKIVEQLSNFYNWRNKLLKLFLKGEASPEVMLDIYREYRTRINAINERRFQMIRELEEKINELTAKLENMRIRHEIGEIPDRQYITEKLSIDRELSRLKPRLNILHNVFNVKIADVPQYEATIRELKERIASEGAARGLGQEDIDMIISDLQETLDGLQDLLEQHRKLKKELEKIEVRYKVGELTEEEYQAMRQKIERQMEM